MTTECIETKALLLALEPETKGQAIELLSTLSGDALKYLLKGAKKLVIFILVEQGDRYKGEVYLGSSINRKASP